MVGEPGALVENVKVTPVPRVSKLFALSMAFDCTVYFLPFVNVGGM